MKRQCTIKDCIKISGKTLHSGIYTNINFKPAEINKGIYFVRTDVQDCNNIIAAHYINIYSTALATRIRNSNNIQVHTIEHLMSSLWSMGIDNLRIEIDGPEIPILDGSSLPFINLFNKVGVKKQNASKKLLKVDKDIAIFDADKAIICKPNCNFEIVVEINFDNKVVGIQAASFKKKSDYDKIAPARAFLFLSEVEDLKKENKMLGADLTNSICIKSDNILNTEGLRMANEFAAHKLLDCLGDFYLAGGHILGSFYCYKTGHSLNYNFLRKLFSDSTNYSWINSPEIN